MTATPFKQVADNAISVAVTSMSGIGITDTTLLSNSGALFPLPGNGFYITLWSGLYPNEDPNMEKILVSARSGDILTHSPTTKTHASPVNVGLLDVAQNTIDLQDAVNVIESNTSGVNTGDQIIPTQLSDLSDDATHRLVTDTEKSTWNAKQDALGYTAENISNKSTSVVTDATSDVKYPSVKAVKDYADTKQIAGSYEVTTNKGANNGYAGLDGGGKVPLTQLPGTLLIYKGVWNAFTNTPTLTTPDLTKAGQVYNVSVAGTQFGIDFKLGDWAIYNDLGVLEKSDNSDDVTSVNGQQGAVTLTTNNIADYLDKRYVTDAQKVLLGNIDQDVKVAASPTFAGATIKGITRTQSGDPTNGCLIIGADVNATTLTNGVRKLGRVSTPSSDGLYSMCLFSGDSDGTQDFVEFGGRPGALMPAPTRIAFTTASTLGDRTTNAYRMIIDKDGLVGINEINSTSQLHINTKNATTRGLLIKGFASQTANLFEAQNSAGSPLASIDQNGILYTAGAIKTPYLYNTSGTNNSKLELLTTGMLISRNVADASSALIVNQINASSTGKILDLQSEGVSKVQVSRSGNMVVTGDLYVANINNSNDYANARITPSLTGTLITRNISDANTALIINQVHASSIGAIVDAQFGGVSKFSVSAAGVVRIASNLILSTNIQNTNGANYCTIAPGFNGAVISRNFADANSALIVNQIHASSTGDVLTLQFGGVTKARFDINGYSYQTALSNITSSVNALIRPTSNGTVISRDVADTNSALIINQINSGSTGKILDAQFEGVSKASISYTGTITTQGTIYGSVISNITSVNNSKLTLGSTGAIISRDIADANDALIVNQINASSTGNIQQWQFGGVLKAQMSNAGALRILELTHITTRNNANIQMTVAGARVTRNVPDANPALIANNYQGTANIFEAQYNSVIKSAIDKDGLVRQQNSFAEIYVSDNTTAQSIPTGTTYTKITAFTTDGLSTNCTADSANDKITITKVGKYRVSLACSFSDGSNVEWRVAAFLGGVEQSQLHFHRKMGAGGDVGSASFNGFINVTSANTDLDIRARHDQIGSQNITISYSNLTVEYIGE